jgi:hypothetical protein
MHLDAEARKVLGVREDAFDWYKSAGSFVTQTE